MSDANGEIEPSTNRVEWELRVLVCRDCYDNSVAVSRPGYPGQLPRLWLRHWSEDQAGQELKLPDLLNSDAVREIHANIEKEWDFLQRSACQTAAGRALWKHAIHDPLADLLAGETYLRNLHEKIKKDILNNARETSGVILAVRTLWFDSRLEDALNSTNSREAQVVLLGAGLSTLRYILI
ncbi:hypothetical protein JHK87_047776 [Glycine soja]|nr:hypothetical protein JHK87_047776 [Glycine soja]